MLRHRRFQSILRLPPDWAGLERMADSGTLDTETVIGVLVSYLGSDDVRIRRLRDPTASRLFQKA